VRQSEKGCTICGRLAANPSFAAPPSRPTHFIPATCSATKCGTVNKNIVTILQQVRRPGFGLQLNTTRLNAGARHDLCGAAEYDPADRICQGSRDRGQERARHFKEQEVFFGEIPLIPRTAPSSSTAPSASSCRNCISSPGVFLRACGRRRLFPGQDHSFIAKLVELRIRHQEPCSRSASTASGKFYGGSVFLRALGLRHRRRHSEDLLPHRQDRDQRQKLFSGFRRITGVEALARQSRPKRRHGWWDRCKEDHGPR